MFHLNISIIVIIILSFFFVFCSTKPDEAKWFFRISSIDCLLSGCAIKVEDFDSIFSLQKGQHPVLLKNFLAKRISLETMVILDGLLNYVGKWDMELHDDLIWPDSRRLIVKYRLDISS